MMNCNFTLDGQKWKCTKCGRTSRLMPGRKAPKANCKSPPPPPPGDFAADLEALDVETEPDTLTALWHRWRASIAKWKAAGKPVRSPEEMAACLAVCTGAATGRPCEHFDKRLGVLGKCTVCGCGVSAAPIGEVNKIRMATENCPLGKWPG